MNVDITYYHNRFRLSEYSTYAVLADLNTRGREVRVEQPDIPVVRNMSEDRMRALIEAKLLSVQPAPEPEAKELAVGDIWLTRRGTYAAITYGAYIPATGQVRMTAVELHGRAPTAYEVDHTGGFVGRGRGERHPLDLMKRARGFL